MTKMQNPKPGKMGKTGRIEVRVLRLAFMVGVLVCSGLIVGGGCDKGKEGAKAEPDFEIEKLYERGPLTVHVRLDKPTINIAETLLLEFEAAIEQSYELQMPKVDKVLENFGIVDWDNLGDRLDDKNNRVRIYRYRLEPFLSGEYRIPAFTFEFYDANCLGDEEKKHSLATEPIDVEVTSLLGEQRSELVIADIEDVVLMPQESSFRWTWVLIAAVAVAAVVGGLVYLRRKRGGELVRIFKPAHEIAYARLRALVKEDLIKAGKIKQFYERISDILRHYIEHRFALRAPERTTDEFLIELQYTDVLGDSDKQSVGEFLRHCDLVKFARHDPTAEQIQHTFDLVKSFIEKTASDEEKVDVTDTIEPEQTEETVEAGSV